MLARIAAVAATSRSAFSFAGAARRFFGSLPPPVGLSEEQGAILEVAQSFARDKLAPKSAEWDAKHVFPVDTLREAAELGFAGLFCSEDHGGTGLTRLDGALVFEALAHGDVATTAYLTIHNMVAAQIDRYGSEAVKARFLPRLTSMEALASYCLTEPGAGSDAASLQASATPVDGGWQLTGSKAFISGAGVSDVYLVMARQPADPGSGKPGPISAFLVEKGSAGLSFGANEHKMGWRAQPTAAVNLDKVFVPSEQMLGKPGEGFKIAMSALDGGRVNIGACSIGGAAFALDYAWTYTGERKQFATRVRDMQATQFRLADMATQLQASRLLVHQAARELDAKAPSASLSAAMAKRFATDACFGVASDALQLLGGYGYLCDYPLERVVRDLRVHSILEGTNEVMRVVIERNMGKVWYEGG